MVFQENNLFAHLDVGKNVGLGRSPSLRLTAADKAAVAEALERTGLAGKEHRLPRELSGGERQRVALARVLVRNRPVLLLDEPFASLGPALRDDMLDLLVGVQAERRMTVLFVTHQPEDARRVADDMVFLEDGAVAAAGPTETFFGEGGPEAFRRYIGTPKHHGICPEADIIYDQTALGGHFVVLATIESGLRPRRISQAGAIRQPKGSCAAVPQDQPRTDQFAVVPPAEPRRAPCRSGGADGVARRLPGALQPVDGRRDQGIGVPPLRNAGHRRFGLAQRPAGRARAGRSIRASWRPMAANIPIRSSSAWSPRWSAI